MQAKDVVATALKSTQELLNWYVADLSDEDFQVQPVPGANTIAWQVGHLAVAERMVEGTLPGAKYPDLPYAPKPPDKPMAMTLKDGLKKAELLEHFNQARGITLAAVAKLADADFDKPTTGDMAKWAPTLGALLVLTSNHTLMHAGQFTVVRRALKKPVLF